MVRVVRRSGSALQWSSEELAYDRDLVSVAVMDLAVGSDDLTLEKTFFNQEGTFGPGFGRNLIRKIGPPAGRGADF